MPDRFQTDIRSVAMYLVSALGAVLLLSIFVTLLSALNTLWGQ